MHIDIPNLPRSPYSLIVVLSVIIGFTSAILLMRKFKVGKDAIFYTSLLTFVCTLFISLAAAIRFTSEGLQVGFSGLAAVVGMVIGIFISTLIIRDKPECVMASFVAAAPLMYGLAKFGCLFAGCCHGKPYDGIFAVVYHSADGGSYFPAQIVDLIVFLISHVIALILILRMKNKVRAIFIIVGIVIPVRFILEYLRFYHDGSVIASGQITVLVAGAIALVILFVWKKIVRPGEEKRPDLTSP